MTKLTVWLIVLGVAQARGAAAATPSDGERADVLFASARKHMDEGDYLAASAELSESQDLDPTVGTALNLAYCYERMGRTATAWSMWLHAAAAAAAKGQLGRQQAALSHASALQARLLHATVTVTPQAARDHVPLAVDRAPLPRNAWGLPVPLDPGTHELLATANGYQPWSHEFVVAPGAEPNLVVPELAPIVSSGGAPATSKGSAWNALLWTTGATGVGAAGVGTWFGVTFLSNRDAANQNCKRLGCNAEGLSEIAGARNDAIIADTLFAVAGAAVVTGAVTYVFFRPSQKAMAAWSPIAEPVLGVGAALGVSHGW